MPLKGDNGQEFESFESCVTKISDDRDITRSEAQRICGSFEEVDKEMKNEDEKVKVLDRLTKWLIGDHGQDDVEQELHKGMTVGNLIEAGIQAESDVNTSEKELMKDIAELSDTTENSVKNAINGNVNCPDQRIINAASQVLPIDKQTLILAGRADGCDYSMRKEFEEQSEDILEKNDEKQIVTGIVAKADRPDLEGDEFPSEVVEKMSYNFMKDFQTVGLGHEVAVDDAHIVESYLAKTDQEINGTQVKKNDWVMSVKVENDEMWKEVKDGNINGFSVGGRYNTVPVEETE